MKTCLAPGALTGVSASARLLAVGTGGVLSLYDVKTGSIVRTLELGDSDVSEPAFSPDGTKLAVSMRSHQSPTARIEWFELDSPAQRRGQDVDATPWSTWSSSSERLYVNENYGTWRVIDAKRGTTIARRRFGPAKGEGNASKKTSVTATPSGLFARTHEEWKQTISPLDDALREQSTWPLPDGDGTILGAVDRTRIVFANRRPERALDAPTDVVLIADGAIVRTLGTLPGASYDVTRRPDGTFVVLAVPMEVDAKPDGLFIVDPERGRVEHHRLQENAPVSPPTAISPDGRTFFAATGHSDRGACVVGFELPAR